eukprot:SAG11_NODE_8318_length_1029_cov_2.566667_2_plen_34_part_01
MVVSPGDKGGGGGGGQARGGGFFVCVFHPALSHL